MPQDNSTRTRWPRRRNITAFLFRIGRFANANVPFVIEYCEVVYSWVPTTLDPLKIHLIDYLWAKYCTNGPNKNSICTRFWRGVEMGDASERFLFHYLKSLFVYLLDCKKYAAIKLYNYSLNLVYKTIKQNNNTTTTSHDIVILQLNTKLGVIYSKMWHCFIYFYYLVSWF